ncbi:hypothetical protein BD289DRAFT_430850 [Coniella lustricola]|uniref:DNA polymerase n=1 Tax=Coniella lustricola TaxID=2025994 RepID=A0A2T3ABH5_9PEZI|nr:hypothetical protein BD289DRAFT_430850 [Coniella lustricola]
MRKSSRSRAYAPRSTPSPSTASPLTTLDLDIAGRNSSIVAESANVCSNSTIPQAISGQKSRDAMKMKVADDIVENGRNFGDDLSQIIGEVRQRFQDVPPLEEDEADLKPSKAKNYDSDAETQQEPKQKKQKKRARKDTSKTGFDERFACNRGGTKEQIEDKSNPNAFIISVFRKMLDYYTQINDHWRRLAYTRAITTLASITDRRISSAHEARELPNFGESLSTKLEEIVSTHNLKRLQYAMTDPISQVKMLFLGIYGVGPSTAERWIAQGHRTLDDLLQGVTLTFSQKIGIEHYGDLNSRIPRDEVTKMADYVKAEAAKIDSKVELIVGGSYRRGATTSGDIDFIITKEGTTSNQQLSTFLITLVRNLGKQGFLTAELAAHSSSKDHDGSKWHGCCVLPRIPGFNDNGGYKPVWRRIDLLLVPETEYGAALIYFTGNDIFNRSLRLLASKQHMRLNQRGLYKDTTPSNDRLKGAEGELIEGRDERKIFKTLGVVWREPHERWC